MGRITGKGKSWQVVEYKSLQGVGGKRRGATATFKSRATGKVHKNIKVSAPLEVGSDISNARFKKITRR